MHGTTVVEEMDCCCIYVYFYRQIEVILLKRMLL